MTEYVTTNIRLPKDLYRRLKRQALEEEKSLSQIVRESVSSYLTGVLLARSESPADAVQAGSVSDSLWQIGSDPVTADVTDGSINHDRHLYGPLSERAQTEIRDQAMQMLFVDTATWIGLEVANHQNHRAALRRESVGFRAARYRLGHF